MNVTIDTCSRSYSVMWQHVLRPSTRLFGPAAPACCMNWHTSASLHQNCLVLWEQTEILWSLCVNICCSSACCSQAEPTRGTCGVHFLSVLADELSSIFSFSVCFPQLSSVIQYTWLTGDTPEGTDQLLWLIITWMSRNSLEARCMLGVFIINWPVTFHRLIREIHQNFH